MHPAVDGRVDEAVKAQGHSLRFMTVGLAALTLEIMAQLGRVTDPSL